MRTHRSLEKIRERKGKGDRIVLHKWQNEWEHREKGNKLRECCREVGRGLIGLFIEVGNGTWNLEQISIL